MKINDINWSYYWDEIKKRKFYIFGFFLLISITSMENWFLIGPIIQDGQDAHIFPRTTTLYSLMLQAVIFVIFAVSWDFLAGYSGQVSFGHALFLGMGAYISSMIKVGLKIGDFVVFPGLEDNLREINGIYMDLSILLAIFYASVIISLFAITIGLFTLRMEGPYFALVTLVLPLIAAILVSKTFEDYTGGEGGYSIFTRANLVHNPRNTELENIALVALKTEQLYQISFAIAIISVLFMYFLARSRYGLVLKSIREDELAASALGVNVSAYKLSAIGISSFFAAIAGGLYVQVLGSATDALFEAERSFIIIIYTILGGIGTIAGSVVGTFLLVIAVEHYVETGFVELPTIKVFIFGIILIIVLKYQARGLINAEPQLRNALFFGTFFSIITIFYDTGLFLSGLSNIINPGEFLIERFGDKELGLLLIDMNVPQGRMLLYFFIGSVIGYFGPDIFQKIRLRLWGVWPSLGKFEPPE